MREATKAEIRKYKRLNHIFVERIKRRRISGMNLIAARDQILRAAGADSVKQYLEGKGVFILYKSSPWNPGVYYWYEDEYRNMKGDK